MLTTETLHRLAKQASARVTATQPRTLAREAAACLRSAFEIAERDADARAILDALLGEAHDATDETPRNAWVGLPPMVCGHGCLSRECADCRKPRSRADRPASPTGEAMLADMQDEDVRF